MIKNKIIGALITLTAINLVCAVNDFKKVEAAEATGIQQLSGTIKRETTDSPLFGGKTTTEEIYRNTGLYFYAITNNGTSSSSANINLDSTSFYVDFSNIELNYQTTTVNSTKSNFTFQLKNSANNVVWYATQNIISSSVNDTTVYQIEQNINGSKVTINESKPKPSHIGKKLVTLPEGIYTIDYSLTYIYYKSPNILNNMAVKETFLNGKIYVDNTKPAITGYELATGKYLTSGAYTNKTVKVEVKENNHNRFYYSLPNSSTIYNTNGVGYTTSTINGWYQFYAIDLVGNRSDTFSFCYDNILPIGAIYSQGNQVANNSYINNSFSYTASDINGISNYYVKKPKNSDFITYTQGSLINKEDGDGWYSFFCVDLAGNVSATLSVYLETSNSLLSIYRNDDLVFSKKLSSSENIDAELYFNRNDELKIICDNSSGSLSSNFEFNKVYKLDNSFSGQKHTINITSQVGVNSNYTFTIIDQKPKLIINGNEYDSGSTLYFKEDTAISWKYDDIIVNPKDTGIQINSTGERIVNEKLLFSEFNATTLTTPADTDTTYNITINDLANNSSTYTIHINKNKPICELRNAKNEILSNGSHVSSNVYLKYDKNKMSIKYSFNNGLSIDCYDNMEFTQEGFYLLTLTDLANNVSLIEFTIDRTPPVGEIYANFQKVESGSYTNGKVYFSWEGSATATVNEINYIKNTMLQDNGNYIFVLTDLAGNSSEYSITVITTNPSYNFDEITSQKELVTKWYNAKINDTLYSFANYQNALDYAMACERNDEVIKMNLSNIEDFTQHHLIAENDSVTTGTYYLYKSKANPNIKLYYFNEASLNEAIRFYASKTITGPHYFGNSNAKYGQCTSEMYNSFYDSEYGTIPIINNYIFKDVDSVKVTAKKIGEIIEKNVEFNVPFKEQFTENGIYEITEANQAGNQKTYYVFLCLTSSTLKVNASIFGQSSVIEMEIDSNKLSAIKDYYYDSFSIKDILNGDKYSLISVAYNQTTTYYAKDDILPTFNKGGEYKITVYDRFSNSYSFNVFIVGQKPNIYFSQTTDELKINVALNENFNTLTSLEIYHNGHKIDDISPEKLIYFFNKSGEYKVTIKDNYGRITTEIYNFDKDKPVGIMNGQNSLDVVEEQINFSYNSTKYYLEVYKDSILVATNSNGLYTALANSDTEGNYEIKLIDRNDENNFSTFNFQIEMDKIAPTITLNGVENNGTTGGQVSITSPSEDCEILVYKDGKLIPYELGENLFEYGKYKVVVTDKFGNMTTYNFQINYKMNASSITLIALGIGGAGIIVLGVILGRKGVYKKKK